VTCEKRWQQKRWQQIRCIGRCGELLVNSKSVVKRNRRQILQIDAQHFVFVLNQRRFVGVFEDDVVERFIVWKTALAWKRIF